MAVPFRLTRICAAAALSATLSLGGCVGADGVELNGKVFDMMGISPSALSANKVEPNIAARPPLVLPPNVAALPEPGSGQVAAVAGDMNWPADPEQKKLAAAKERERLHQAYCRGEIQWKEKVLSVQGSNTNVSPYGSCSGTGSITGSVSKN